MAKTLKIRARVIDNLEYSNKHRECFYFTNTGNYPYKETGWVLYMDSFRSIEPDHLPLPGTVYLPEQHVNVTLIQGQFTAITPVVGFGTLRPNETRELHFFNELWSISRYEFMPNWYLGSDDDTLEPKIIESTMNNSFVDPFVTPRQWKRTKDDVYNPFTPEERFLRNFVEDSGRADKLVIPTPRRNIKSEGEWLRLDMTSCKIIGDSELTNEIGILQEGTGCTHEINNREIGNAIYLIKTDRWETGEAYEMLMNASRNIIQIRGFEASGVFYGIQTLISILASYTDGKLPVVYIKDRPRFPYRGMHLDVARSFHGVEEVEKLIKVMAMYKLNKLHLHLSDDDGWRLEISGLKELTETGGHRCHDLEERKCLLPQLGSGPYTNTSGSGWFTASDYRNILRIASRHHIEVIPEFDFPGHSHAAVRAMEARYQFYRNAGNENEANKFRLVDPDDNSTYLSIQEFSDNAINPCIESTYDFIEHVIVELIDLHKPIQPLRVFHFGGDEVAVGAWIGSPACQKLQSAYPDLKGPEEWKRYFVHRISNITARYNLSLAGWEDGFMAHDNDPYPRQSFTNQDDVAYAWANVWEWGTSMRAYRLANRGYKVVMSQATHLYFDHPEEPDPEERGLNWATRFTDTRKVFGFMPDNLYENIDTLISGRKTSKSYICGNRMQKCDALDVKENVIGMQGQIWTEIVRSSENLHHMVFPRLLALAERAWHKAEWEDIFDMRKTLLDKDWAEFANSLGHKELMRLDKIGVNYRVPVPGARVNHGYLDTCSVFPGLTAQYSVDNGVTWKQVPKKWPQPTEPVLLRAQSADGKRYSRSITLDMLTTGGGNIYTFNIILSSFLAFILIGWFLSSC